QHGLSSTRMANRTFNIPKNKGTPKAVKVADPVYLAARYLVYKLYEATAAPPHPRAPRQGARGRAPTTRRAPERDWLVHHAALAPARPRSHAGSWSRPSASS